MAILQLGSTTLFLDNNGFTAETVSQSDHRLSKTGTVTKHLTLGFKIAKAIPALAKLVEDAETQQELLELAEAADNALEDAAQALAPILLPRVEARYQSDRFACEVTGKTHGDFTIALPFPTSHHKAGDTAVKTVNPDKPKLVAQRLLLAETCWAVQTADDSAPRFDTVAALQQFWQDTADQLADSFTIIKPGKLAEPKAEDVDEDDAADELAA
ncbi:hypothetical protein [Ferrimonas marina]|uniref:Uncharacterized protein n=1 Tax=Ferrimonas marina TaxID=299255 RepID=A0A1M5TVE9_9GAMM|nr:hypothetical protein [Ferrimonas marina]SHH54694.1 hypothetical protein SAMN02745129_2292 [Ferrimonas marina]